MYNMQLWETSGHAANYRDNMVLFEVRNQFSHYYVFYVVARLIFL